MLLLGGKKKSKDKKRLKKFAISQKLPTFALANAKALAQEVDSLAQQVEHIPFKDGVLGSSPKRITEREDSSDSSLFYSISQTKFLLSTYCGNRREEKCSCEKRDSCRSLSLVFLGKSMFIPVRYPWGA